MKPVYILLYVFIFFLNTGCLSITKIQDELGMEPSVPTPINGNEQIIVYQTSFDCLVNGFLSNGYRITQENKDRGYFNCEKVANHRTYIRHIVKLVDNTGTITTEWKTSSYEHQPDWTPSEYRDGGGKMTYAFLSGLDAVAACGTIQFK